MFKFQHQSADLYEGISVTKFNNLNVKKVESSLKYTESKLVKKRPHLKEEILKKPLSYILSYTQSGAENCLFQFCLAITELFSLFYLEEMKNY